MKIRKLNLNFYKNHRNLKLELNADVVGIYGLNGVGKTNVLDAIHFLCVGRSYFSGTDQQCIMHDQASAGIVAEIEEDQISELKLILKRGKRKRIEKNNKAYKRVIDHVGQFFSVTIAPGDIELIYGTNEIRRSFVNKLLSQTNKSYLEALMRYKKLLEQRNAHLKSEDVDRGLITVIDEQLAPLAHFIFDWRAELFIELAPLIQQYYSNLSREHESVEVNYSSGLMGNDYLALVAMNEQKDLVLHRSNSGIHKDEIDFIIDGQSIKKFGSQGQIKSFLIAIKLAEYQYYMKHVKKLPLLLLDDIFEKIDQERAEALTGIIKSGTFGQIFISDTEEDRIKNFCTAIGKSHQLVAL